MRRLSEVGIARFRHLAMEGEEMLDSLSNRGTFKSPPDLVDAIRALRTNLRLCDRSAWTKKLDVIVFETNPDFTGAGLKVGRSLFGELFRLIRGGGDLNTDIRCRGDGFLNVACGTVWIQPEDVRDLDPLVGEDFELAERLAR